MKSIIKVFFVFSALTIFYSCYSNKSSSPISDFDIQKYLGKWYEVGRINFPYERNMSNVSSEFYFDEQENLIVINRGYNYVQHKWKKATGKIRKGNTRVGILKVSFFYPIYFDYIILAIDEKYNYAMVGTSDLDYLWILSRNPEIPHSIKEQYINMAKTLGYDTSSILWTVHNKKKDSIESKE